MKSKIAQWLLTLAALVTIVLPSMMDLNETHMTNPLWPPHARFHWSIQWYAITILNGVALFLLWGKFEGSGSRLAVTMAALAPVLFWGSFFTSLLMPGTSPWPDGVVPFAKLPPNVYIAAVVSGTACLGWFIDRGSRARPSTNS